MGEVKESMKKSGKIKSRGSWFKRPTDPVIVAETFADHVDIANAMLIGLIDVKTDDLTNECSSKLTSNDLKLNMLNLMKHHIDSVEKLINMYGDIE